MKKFLFILMLLPLLVLANNLTTVQAQTTGLETCGSFARGDLIIILKPTDTLEGITPILNEYNITIKRNLGPKMILGFIDVSCDDTKRIGKELSQKGGPGGPFKSVQLNWIATIYNK